MKSLDRNRFKKIAGCLREPLFCDEAESRMLSAIWENAIKLAVRSLEERGDPRLDKPVAVMKSYLNSVFSGMVEVMKAREPYDVVCHGDLWINNILLR